MSKRCETCLHWAHTFTRSDEKFGECDHPSVDGKILIDKDHDVYDEETIIHTSANFGCIYHTPLHENVVTKLPGGL